MREGSSFVGIRASARPRVLEKLTVVAQSSKAAIEAVVVSYLALELAQFGDSVNSRLGGRRRDGGAR